MSFNKVVSYLTYINNCGGGSTESSRYVSSSV